MIRTGQVPPTAFVRELDAALDRREDAKTRRRPGDEGPCGLVPHRGIALVKPFLWLSVAAGCVGTGHQDMLAPQGPQAARIAEWFWVSTALGTAIFLVYCGLLGYALWRARRNGEENFLPPRHGRNLVIWGGIGVPVIVLLGLLVYSVYVDRLLATLGNPRHELLTIEVTGHQFWWEVRYRDAANPWREFITANEIHIPVGQPVRFVLQSRDVIHSFWVPNLHGKLDMIPGRSNELVLQADQAGVYRGQCAEFCGIQHAKMLFLVIAEPPEAFAAWWDRQLQPAPEPVDPVVVRGREVFMRNGCGICHAIRGTEAFGAVAPDLSWFGLRRTLAAGVRPNTRGHLAGWIADPQGVKPGNFMPAVALHSEDLQALLRYLHSLR
jgi:cytochrome c oxidase subunit II